MTAEQGLRERKKQRTRELIVERAMALFDERGFERVTIAEIAAAADIAPRTFFGYFKAKEDVVFHDFEAFFASLRERLAGRPEGESTLDALHDWLGQVIGTMDHDSPAEQRRRRVVLSSPALQEHDRSLISRFERELALGMARDLGEPDDALRVRMVAAAAAAALQELERFFDKDAGLAGDPMAVIDQVFVFVRGGVDALRGS